MEAELLKGLANGGPIAIVAGILLWQLIQDRKADRELMRETLGTLSSTMQALKAAVERMSDRQDRFNESIPEMVCQNFKPIEDRRGHISMNLPSNERA
jgi:hypothetical protein